MKSITPWKYPLAILISQSQKFVNLEKNWRNLSPMSINRNSKIAKDTCMK